MSNTDNPFAEPADNPFSAPSSTYENPFVQDENPFAASVNPFQAAAKEAAASEKPRPLTASSPFTVKPVQQDVPPASSSSQSPFVQSSDVTKKMEELSRRELELEQRQQLLLKKESDYQRSVDAGKGPRPPNWPRCCPILHHDIAGEIPQEGQWIVRRQYMLWILLCVACSWNFICFLSALVTKVVDTTGFILAILYVFIMPPIALYFYYLMLYGAFRLSKASRFVVFFCNFGLHILCVLFWLVGWKEAGGAGIIMLIDSYQANEKVVGTFIIIMVCLWTVLEIGNILQFRSVHQYYRGRGGSITKDTSAMVRDEAGNAAMAGVQSGQFNNLLVAGAKRGAAQQFGTINNA